MDRLLFTLHSTKFTEGPVGMPEAHLGAGPGG